MSGDFLHHGHINLLQQASEFGPVTVGLLTDRAVSERKKIPLLTYEQRKSVIESLKVVDVVIAQNEWSYEKNILSLKPKFFVHGDDWMTGTEFSVRLRVIDALESYGGKLVEVPYTTGVSAGALRRDAMGVSTTPEVRRSMLRRSLGSKALSRFIEAHSPLSALVAENAFTNLAGNPRSYDGVWSSSLTDSTVLGKPDTEVVSIASRLDRINEMFEVTTLPLIFDADTGGQPEHLALHMKSMERLGISAVIVEDKEGLKKNSLLGTSVPQLQASVDDFCHKIKAAVEAKSSADFMFIARIESFILQQGMEDALLRAKAYVGAGADGIMIHSRASSPDEVIAFARHFRDWDDSTPLVCVPTTYNSVSEQSLENSGFNIVIYANHLLRASYPAMMKTAESILKHSRSAEVDESLTSISEILSLVPGTR